MRRRQRIAAAGLAVVVTAGLSALAAVPEAGAAAPAGRSTPSAPAKSLQLARDDQRIDTGALARQFGVPAARLERALDDAKRVVSGLPEGGRNSTWSHPGVVAAVAHDLGISRARAGRLLAQLPWFAEGVGASKGDGRTKAGSKAADEPAPAAVVADIAGTLHVSNARVRAALQQLSAIQARSGQLRQDDPAFVAAARSLGVSAQMLENAMRTAKQHLAAADGVPGRK